MPLMLQTLKCINIRCIFTLERKKKPCNRTGTGCKTPRWVQALPLVWVQDPRGTIRHRDHNNVPALMPPYPNHIGLPQSPNSRFRPLHLPPQQTLPPSLAAQPPHVAFDFCVTNPDYTMALDTLGTAPAPTPQTDTPLSEMIGRTTRIAISPVPLFRRIPGVPKLTKYRGDPWYGTNRLDTCSVSLSALHFRPTQKRPQNPTQRYVRGTARKLLGLAVETVPHILVCGLALHEKQWITQVPTWTCVHVGVSFHCSLVHKSTFVYRPRKLSEAWSPPTKATISRPMAVDRRRDREARQPISRFIHGYASPGEENTRKDPTSAFQVY
jgi:hypothetical protein